MRAPTTTTHRLQSQLRKRAQSRHVGRPHEQGRHARLAPRTEPVADALARADQRHLVDELVGYSGDRFTLLPAELQLLNALRLFLVAVPLDERVVEVRTARAHAADIEREHRSQ